MMLYLFVFVGIYLHALGGGDCGLDRLYPSSITADSVYSSSYPVENLIDGAVNTYWWSASGDTSDYVYFEFNNNVDLKHIMIKEGTYWVSQINIYDTNTGVQMGWTTSDDPEDYKIYNFWFSEWVTDKFKIYFTGSQGSWLVIDEVSVWGCNMTSTLPTAVPTVSPSQMPTNHTPTAMPTNLPSVSPTQIPTSSSPTEPPSNQPSLSPSMAPTSTLVPSSSPTMTPTSSLLPTSSPTLYPTLEVNPSSDEDGTAATTRTDGDSIVSIGVLEVLIVIVFVLVITVVYLFFKLNKGQVKVSSLNERAKQQTHNQIQRL